MSKILKDAALVVGVIAVGVATAGALAAPGSALALSLSAAASTVGLSSSAALAGAIGALDAGLSVLSQVTAKRPKASVSPMSWQADPEAGFDYVMGEGVWAGKIIYRNAWGSHNGTETLISQLSLGPIQGFETMYVDGVATGWVEGGAAATADRGKMYVSTQRGLQPEAKQLGDLGPPGWTTSSKLSGLAATSVSLIYDPKGKVTFTTEPQLSWRAKWVLAYDPRKDSTYPGGNGAHRIGDEGTWEWTANPALHGLTWIIGRRQNGKLVAGIGAPIAGIVIDQFVEAANVADRNGWTMFGAVNTAPYQKWAALKDILSAGGAEPIRLGAQIGCMVRTPRVSLTTVTSADVAGDWSVQATQSRRDRINAIVPRYMAEQSVTTQDGNGKLVTTVTWGMASASPVVVDAYVTFDGGQRQRQVDYKFVTSVTQAGQLTRYDIEDAREFGPIDLPLKLRFYGYKPGDVITCQIPEMGLVGQDILILNRTLSPQNGTVRFKARSETAAKHPFALGQTLIPPATPSLGGPPLLPTPGQTAWEIVATAVSTAAGVQPALVIEGACDTTVADAIVIEYREWADGLADDAGWMAGGIFAPSATQIVVSGLKGAVSYEAAISYRVGPQTGPRAYAGPVVAGELAIDFDKVTGANKPENGATRNNPRGEWQSGTGYALGDMVSYEGSSYICIQAHQADGDNCPPNASYWKLLAAAGASGPAGYHNLVLQLYQRSGSEPAKPSQEVAVTFSTSDAQGINNGWQRSIPDGSDPLWGTAATANSQADTDKIEPNEWSDPVQVSRNGLNSATLFLYQRAQDQPNGPSQDITYTFATGDAQGINNGWQRSAPSGSAPLWMTQATADSSGATDVIQPDEWSVAVILARDGKDGVGAVTGAQTFAVPGQTAGPVPVAAGATLPVYASVTITPNSTNPSRATLTVSVSTDDGNSWTDLASSTLATPSGEPDTVETGANYTNTSGARIVARFRATLTLSSGTPSQGLGSVG